MKTLLVLGFFLAQNPTPDVPADQAEASAPAPAVEPWDGTLAEGLAGVKRLAETGEAAEALAITERLLEPNAFSRWRDGAISKPGWKRTAALAAGPVFEAIGLRDLTDPERATVYHARGVVLAQSADERRVEAVGAFERARALAGPGDLRLDATYDAGWTWLAEGETLRAKIPEIANPGSPPQSPATPPPGGAAGAAPPPPDPLDLARAAYLQARERFVDRLKLDASDADTRANAELTQKRLRELEEIAKKRQEEKKKQEQEQKDEEQKDSKDQESKDEQKDDQQKKDDEKKDSDAKPDEQQKPDEQTPDEKPPEDPKDEQAEPQDPSETKDPKKAAQPKPSQEELMTREEVMRLLETLKNREAEGKKLQEQLRNARRVPVKKDW